ncbi:MAG: hypothetical protein GQ567_05150 [Methanosarcinales archaeon]|nr:hypothetical protein [Methanosarcinales archaeon]
MNKSTFEITASIGAVLFFILMCAVFNSISAGGVGFLAALLLFILVISAAGFKLADFGE